MYKSIAIIGISFELPGIGDWAALSQSLNRKDINVGALPPGRLRDVQARYGPVDIAAAGFLDRIDLYDNEFFDQTEREAMKTFPEQRLFLLHAMRAFYDAGYTAKDIQASLTGIFLSPARSQYPAYISGQYDFFDTLTGIEATRLARFLDIRGPIMSVNTTCSSSLMAIHNACLSLEHGECNMALTGGVKLGTITKENAATFVVISRKGECRPFDKDADGMMNGEGAVCMVLKRLEDAERDGDPIYATIEGRGVNHGGARITSLTAPSIEAQKEVILKAWDNARIAPADVKFIEAHGTGTILGDPIEFSGINEAFAEKGIAAPTCKISSVKAQVGHLDTMCGMAGLLRVVAALNNHVIPPQANFDVINEHIDEAGSAVRVQREPEYWEDNKGLRVGGVSSFGLTGTNVHLVIAHREKNVQPAEPAQPYFLQISETTTERQEQQKQTLIRFLEENPSASLRLFSQKINRLYNAGKLSEGIIFNTREELLEELRKTAEKPREETAFLLLDLDLLSYPPALVEQVLRENSLIRKSWDDVIGETYHPGQIKDNKVRSVLFQYVLYKYLLSLLGNKLQVIARQGESVLQALLNNKLRPVDIINDPGLIRLNEHPFNRHNFEQYLFRQFARQKVVLIDFSTSNDMRFDAAHILTVAGAFNAKERYQLYKTLLAAGREPLKAPNVPVPLPGIQLPVYQLKRFWPEHLTNTAVTETVAEKKEAGKAQPQAVISLEAIRERVVPIWKQLLEMDADIAPADDFFLLGGDSISGLDMLSMLDKEFNGKLVTYEEMYSFSTLEKLCAVLHERLNPQQEEVKEKPVLVTVEDTAARKERYQQLLNAIKASPVPGRVAHRDILVTGATGLLGSFLVKKLLNDTGANIVCLVRGKDNDDALRRFQEIYSRNFGLGEQERIKVVKGDLNNEDLFKDPQLLSALEKVNTVYHAAGSPAFVGSPNLEEHINYKGTRHLFDWALKSGIQYFNYISTIGITGQAMPAHIEAFYETDLNLGQQTANFVHSGTKLLAEEYINKHRSGSIAVNTYRISNIGGRYHDGFAPFNMNKNLMYMKLHRLYKAGYYSDEFLEYNLNLKITPVDLLANTIGDLSFYRHELPEHLPSQR